MQVFYAKTQRTTVERLAIEVKKAFPVVSKTAPFL
jgi:hypothetical protein